MTFRRARKILAVVAVAIILLAVIGTLAMSVHGINWRVNILAMKASGKIDELTWSELVSMIGPGSPFYLEPMLETPNPYAIIQSPYMSDADLSTGERLFQEQCGLCHGARGDGGAAPSLVGRSLVLGDSDWSFFRTAREGLPEKGMPPAELTDTQVWQVVSYVRTLRNRSSDLIEEANNLLEPTIVTPDRLENAESEPGNWLTYSGSYRSWRYSNLPDITVENAPELKLAWAKQFDTSEFIEASPIVVDGIMYLSIPASDVVALDASTGETLWRFRRSVPTNLPLCCGRVNRGVAVLGDRVYIGTLDGYLVALDAQTGSRLWEVPVGDYTQGYTITGAPLAVRDLIIVGVAGGEFGVRGFLDAYDATTGERRWRFYTIPEPGDFGSETWMSDAWMTGGGPTWLTGSFDPELDLLYWGVGNPAPPYNADVRPGDNLFTNSVVALNIDSGERVWHFQFTPNDEHDWDSNQIPVLVDREIDGEQRALMLWGNRNGFYYVLDRTDGEFLHASPFVTQTWAEGIDENGRPILSLNASPSERGTLTWPGLSGGANWWSPAYSPDIDLIFVPFADAPKVFFKNTDLNLGDLVSGTELLGSASVSTGDRMPVGIRALDPNSGEIAWEYWRKTPRRDNGRIGGTLVTAGNVLFFGDLTEFIALNASNGNELWRTNLGGGINASPVGFSIDGTQHVAIPAGNTLYAFRP